MTVRLALLAGLAWRICAAQTALFPVAGVVQDSASGTPLGARERHAAERPRQ